MNRLRQVLSLPALVSVLLFVPSLIAQNPTSLSLTAPVSSTLGESITIQAVVSDDGTPQANPLKGTIQFRDATGTPELFMGAVRVAGSPVSITVRWTTSSLPPGQRKVKAEYIPDDLNNFVGSSAAQIIEVAQRGTTTVLTLSLATVTVRSASSATVVVTDADVGPSSGKFVSKSNYDLQYARQGHTTTVIPTDGSFQVLVVGGESGSSPVTTSEIFNGVKFTDFIPASGAFAVRTGGTATPLQDGTVLFAGGYDGGKKSPDLEIYDPATQTVTSAKGPNRYNHAAVLLPDGSVLLMGGTDFDGNSLDTAEIYDPQNPNPPDLPNLSVARSGLSATLLTSGPNAGKILVVGGGDPSFELYSISGTTISSFPDAPSFHSATLLPDGNVLVVGGGTPSTQRVWLYVSQENAFTEITSSGHQLITARSGQTANLLPDGTVVVIGGTDNAATPAQLASAELYTPSYDPLGTASLSASPTIDSSNLTGCTLTPSGTGATQCTTAKVSPPHFGTGSYQIYATYDGSSNHASNTSAAQTLTVSKQPLNIVAQKETKVYDSTTHCLLPPTVAGALPGDQVTVEQFFAAKDVSPNSIQINPSLVSILDSVTSVSVADDYDVQLTSVPDGKIDPRVVPILANLGQSKVYGETDPALDYDVDDPGLAGTEQKTDAFTGALSRVAGQSVGSAYDITQGTLVSKLNSNGVANYQIKGFTSAQFSITRRPIGAKADAGQTKIYGEADPATFTFIATGVTGNPVSGLAPPDTQSDVFSGAAVRAPGEAAGPHAITQGTLAVNSNYELQQFVSADFVVTKRPIGVKVNAGQTKIYGENDPVFTYVATAVTGNTVSGLVTNPARTASGVADTESAVFAGNLSRNAGQSVGVVYPITQGTLAVKTTYANYDLQQFTDDNFAITKRPIAVKVTAGQSKVYGEADPVLNFSGVAVTGNPISGLAINNTATGSQDTEAVVFSGALVRAQAGTNAGQVVGSSYAITQGSVVVKATYANYDLQQFSGDNFAITKRPIGAHVSTGQGKVYGEADPAQLTFTAVAITGNPASGLASGNTATGLPDQPSDVFSGTLVRAPGNAAGSYAITQNTLAVNGNYVLQQYMPENFSIAQRPIGAKATGQTKVYGENDPAFTFVATGVSGNSISGLAANNTASGVPDTQSDVFSGTLSRASGQAVGTYVFNQGTLAVSGNYDLQEFASDTLAITKRPIAVSVNPQAKLYGQLDPAALVYTAIALSGNPASGLATTNTASGAPDTQASVFSGTPQRAPGEAAGMYGIAQNTVAVNGNYDLQPANFSGGSFVITPANTFTTKLTQAVVANSLGAYKITINVSYDPAANGSACHQELAGVGTAGCIPDNTVSLKEGSTTLDTQPLSLGAATSKALVLSPGQHTFLVTYNGSLNFASSVKTLVLNVAAGPTTSVQPSSTPVSVPNVTVSNTDVTNWPVAGVVSLASDANGAPGFDALKPNYLGCAVIWSARTVNSKPTCEIVSPPTSIPSGGNATFTVNIKTAAFSAAVRPGPGNRILRDLYAMTLGLPAFVFIGLAGAEQRSRKRHRALTAIGLLLITLWMIGLIGCGGGSFDNPANKQPVFGTQETEAGSYAAVVYYAPANFANTCQTTTCTPEPMSMVTFTIGQ